MATTSSPSINPREDIRVVDLIGPRLLAIGSKALPAGVIGVTLSLVGAVLSPNTFFQSYLFAYMFVFGLTLGSTAWLMAHHVTGGGWGFVLRRQLEAATRNWPLVIGMFVPVAIGMWLSIGSSHPLYIWANPSAAASILPPGASPEAASDAAREIARNVALKAMYLNPLAWTIRAAVYFAIWTGLAFFLNKWSREEDTTDDPYVRHRLTTLSGVGLLIFIITITFAVIDWVMSIEPMWYSSLFGCIFLVGEGHSVLCLSVVLLRLLAEDLPILRKYERRYVRDIGNLMLAFTLLWAYVSVDQWLIYYSANIPDEAAWFIHRTTGGWQFFGGLIVIFHFALPFTFLLMSMMKVNLRNLAKLAAFLLFIRIADLFFYVVPTFQATRPSPFSGLPGGAAPFAFLADIGLPLGLAGLWLWSWTGQMKAANAPVVPVFDPRLDPDFTYNVTGTAVPPRGGARNSALQEAGAHV